MPPGGDLQSALAPAGPQALLIHHLWSLMLWTTTAVFVVVMGFVLAALLRGRRPRSQASPSSTSDASLARGVAAAVGITVLVLIVLLAASVWTGRATSVHATSAVSIAVIGHQWWWEIEYEDASPDRRARTANEIHIPVNQPVVFKVTSRDVIHSLWVPNLHGKRDLIPGYTTAIVMQADRPGVLRGQCAEFCGLEHARMALVVVAEPEADFQRWLDGLRRPARPPQTAEQARGLDVFMNGRCGGCHTVRGTGAHGEVAPDLTHFGGRRSLGAATLPNTPEHRRAWIANAQAIKPGNQMPANPMAAADLDALTAYLGALQ